MKCKRVGLVGLVAVEARLNVILVSLTGLNVGNKCFPYSRLPSRVHGMALIIPAVERTHHRNFFGVRRPDRKVDAAGSILRAAVRAQVPVEPDVASFVE